MTLYMLPNSHEKTQYNAHLLKTKHISAHVPSRAGSTRVLCINNMIDLLFFKWVQGKKIEIQDRKEDRKYKLLLMTSLIIISTNGNYKKMSYPLNKERYSDYQATLCPGT